MEEKTLLVGHNEIGSGKIENIRGIQHVPLLDKTGDKNLLYQAIRFHQYDQFVNNP